MNEAGINSFYPHVSVDCVLLGYNGDSLQVLLLEKNFVENNALYNGMKLPGRLIYNNEDPDKAAQSLLKEWAGIHNAYLKQFRVFGDPERTSRPEDLSWLQGAVDLKVGRIVTVAYMALIRITSRKIQPETNLSARWCPVNEVPPLAFDHNIILKEALIEIRKSIRLDPSIIYRLLPPKFTLLELRRLYEVVYDQEIDVRNFHKKVKRSPYLVALDEKEENVAHRAARYYRFDKVSYNRHLGLTTM